MSLGWVAQAAGDEPDPVKAIDSLAGMCRDLLSGLLTVDEGERLSVEAALQHPWLDELEVRLSWTHACLPG